MLKTRKADIVEVEAEIASVKASLTIEIREVKNDLVRWIVGASALNLLAAVGL